MSDAAVADVTYEDLYARWEQLNWRATEIDFSRDRPDWEALSEIQRKSMRWQFSMFFYGEDSVADNLSPYIDAAPKEEQKYFLATQQVDEARHAVFFARFFKEVLGAGGDTIASGLATTKPELNWCYRKTFDRLDQMADELRKDRSLPTFAQAITLYHIIIEGLLAQPGQHYIEDYLIRMDVMPGFREGMANVARDEQRHIAFGVKTLSELFAASEECKAASAELLREVMRYSSGIFIPPNWDRRYTEELGFSLEDIYAFGFRSFDAKMRATGFPIEDFPPGVLPIDYTLPERERAEVSLAMVKAGLTGEPHPNPDSSPESQRLLFDAVERSVDTAVVNGSPLTIQWRFADAAPWNLRIDNGSTRAEQGEASQADITLETSWRQWVDISSGRVNPRTLVLRRKLRVRPLRQARVLQKVFPG